MDEKERTDGEAIAEVAAAEEAPAAAALDRDLEGEPPSLPAEEVRAILEALIFASPQPITARDISKVLAGVERERWQPALEELRAEYSRDGRGLLPRTSGTDVP